MPSLLFPDAGSRRADHQNGRPAANKTVVVYANSAGTTLAAIYADNAGVPGAQIAGSILTTDSYGYLPLFWGPSSGLDRLYVRVANGPLWPVDADANARLDAVEAGGAGGGVTASYVDNAVATHSADTTSVHGIVDTSALETQAGAQAKADAAVAAHTSDTTSIHGIADTSLLETTDGAQARADTARSDAIAASAQRTANLSDLSNPATARTNLGLGDAATLNVGTAVGTVAAGDDTRLTDARTPTAHAATHAAAGSDPVTVTQAQVTGLSATLGTKADLVGGVIPSAQIPAVALSEFLGEAASQAAMLALSGQRGDWTIRTDTATTWVAVGDDLTQLANWKQIQTPAAPVTSVNGETGTVVLSPADVGALAAGGNLSDVADAATARTNLALGTAATTNTGTGATNTILGNDARLTDARTPTAHAASHASAGSDPITVAQSQVTNLTSDLSAKASLASPALTGTPTAPTASAATNNTQLATTAYVTGAVSTLSGTTTTALGGKVGKGDQTINIRDYGATGDGTTDDTTAINAALAAATPGTTVVFPAPSVAYRITNALTVPAGVACVGSGVGCEIRQATQLKPVFDVFNADGASARGFTLVNSSGPPAAMGSSFRGDSGYAYSAGVWTNSSRITIADLRIRDFGMGVYLNASNGTLNSDGTLRVGNVVRDLEISGANHGVLFLSQSGLRIRGVYYHDPVDSSAGVNPIHGLYGTGTTTLISQDVVVSDCTTVGAITGSAYQFKYVNQLSVANSQADTCFGLLNLIDVFDGTFTALSSRADQTTGTSAYSLTVQTVTNYNQRLTFGDISIQMATDGRPAMIAAHKTRISNLTIVSNHTGADTGGGYDVRLLGTDLTLDSCKIQNVGSVYYRGVLVGSPGYTTGNVTISNLECQKVRQIVDVDASATGVNVIDYSPGLQRDILTSAGTLLIDQMNGTAAFSISRREWTNSTTISGGATATPRPPLETVSRFVVSDSTAFTVAAPVCRPKTGLQQDVLVVNASGGALGTITWNAAYSFRNPFQAPANGETTRVTFVYDGTAWRETLPSLPASTGVPSSRQVIAGTGLTGGGALSSDVTLNVAYGTTSTTAAAGNDSRITGAVQTTRTISTTAPLSGGGDLSANRTLTVSNATTSAVGVVQLAGDLAGTATSPTIATGAVTSAKIADLTIVDGDISASAAIAQSKISGLSTSLSGKVDKGTAFYNVRDYGAVGNNSTNDTAAFTAALAAAGPGGVVYVPPGNYVCDPITLDQGQTLRGSGWYLQRDSTGVFGTATGWTSTTFIQGSIIRSTSTTAEGVNHVDPVTHTGGGIQDIAIIGPGTGTSVGVRLGRDTPSVKAVIGPNYRNVLVANFSTGVVGWHINEGQFSSLFIRGCTNAMSWVHDVNANSWINLNMQRCTTGLTMETGGSCYNNTFVSPICQNLTGDNWTVRGFDNTWISPYHEHPSNPVGPAYLFNMQTGNRNTVINPDVHVTNPMRIQVSSSSHHNTFEMVDVHAARYDIVDNGQSTKFTGDFDAGAPITGTGTNRFVEDRRGPYLQVPRLKYTAGPEEVVGTGHPESTVTAPVGTLYRRTDPAAAADPVFFWKASGTGNTGWRPVRPYGSEDELTATGELWPNRERINSGTCATTTGVLVLAYYTAQKTETINTITVYSGTTAAGATPTLVRAGIYSVASNGDITLVASIPNDTTIFAAAQTAYTRTLSAPFSKVAGVRYAVGMIVVTAAAMPNFHGWQMAPTGVMNTLTREAPALCGRITSQTDLPASATNASIVGFQAMLAMRLNP